ncbi:MAG TPA: helix-turn-helix transcriptional regulator [Methylophilus sp.]|jgi:transcriptional regulator with XRE-family HTH domain|nr:helix-turn-helix transcriptional regulator [Methylophilus sp.]
MSDVVAKRLKEARLAKGLSQKKLGIAAGIDEFTASPRMNQYERGVHIPDYSTLERLAQVLEVPVPYFYAADDELADWIKCFPRLGKAEREKIIAASSND